MDSRNQKKSHPFPHELSRSVHVLGNEAFPIYQAGRCASGLRERLRSGPGEEKGMIAEIFAEFYRDELTLYSRENIMNCCRLLVRRSREEDEAC